MIIVAVDRRSSLQRRMILAKDDDSVFEFIGLDTKLGYSSQLESGAGHRSSPS